MASPQKEKSISDVIQFWFGDIKISSESIAQAIQMKWYKSNPELDDTIRNEFGKLHELIMQGAVDWTKTPEGKLASIVVLDQFTRNMFRNSAKAFASDPLARKICLEGIEQGDDSKLLHPYHRAIFYHPLMHSENKEDHEKSVEQFSKLAQENPNHSNITGLNSFASYAIKHQEIISRFGRYPHRNECLGRQSTPEELKALSEGLKF